MFTENFKHPTFKHFKNIFLVMRMLENIKEMFHLNLFANLMVALLLNVLCNAEVESNELHLLALL